MASSVVQICNRALQKVGARRIVNLDENTPAARECALAYEPCRDALYEMYDWDFAILRASLPAESPVPTWGRANAFPLPSDFIRLAPVYPEDNYEDRDWIKENGKILTNDTAPLLIRYVARIVDTVRMTPTYREALAAFIALELCEPLTQSNTKKAALKADFEDRIKEAKKANAIQKRPAYPAPDKWITTRL